jgi:hypothetical protein
MMYSVGGGARNRHLPYSTARLSHENTPGVYAGTPVLQRLTTLQHAVSHGLSPVQTVLADKPPVPQNGVPFPAAVCGLKVKVSYV